MEQQDILFKLNTLTSRFPRGLELSAQDLVFVGWLYFRENATELSRISDRELRQQLSHAVAQLGMDQDALQPVSAIDRLVRFRLVRATVAESRTQEYCLTRLGRSLARDLLEDADYGSEDLCTLLNQAHASLRQEMADSDAAALSKWLRHFFHGTIREKIEYKLQAIEEGLLDQEHAAKRLGGGQDEQAFEVALATVRKGREYLDELLDAVQDGSAYLPLMGALTECLDLYPAPELRSGLERALDFLEGLRLRIETMLAHLVRFIRQCVAYQSFVGSLSRRDALGRLQLDLVRLALRTPVTMPVIAQGRPCSIHLDWNAVQGQAAVELEGDILAALTAFVPEPVKSMEVPWKADFLLAARAAWSDSAVSSRPLAEWIRELVARVSADGDAELPALWFLLGDMSTWSPEVRLRSGPGPWTPLGSALLQPVILEKEHTCTTT
jgi:hypothetical protein